MKCQECSNNTPWDSGNTLVLVGNMNVGKTTLFNKICPKEIARIRVPGTTVTIKSGRIKDTSQNLLLTPGICSIFSKDEDELISRDILLPGVIDNVSGILMVADAKNMKRSLAVALQYAEYGMPMLLIINMIDEAASRGVEIDHEALAGIFGIDVCTSIAREGIGVNSIISKLPHIRPPKKLITYPDRIEEFLEVVEVKLDSIEIPARVIGLLLLAEDLGVAKYIAKKFGSEMLLQLSRLAEEYRSEDSTTFSAQIGNIYQNRAEQIVRDVQQTEPPAKSPFLETLGDWCTQLHTGIPIAFAVITGLYFFVGTFGATYLVDTINSLLFEGFLIPWTTKLIEPVPSQFLRDMIVDPDFGILPSGIFLALGLVLPVFFIFYIAFGILQDSGYLPRLSILLDKIFRYMGLNGKGAIPLIMGFSCITMAILTTRMLGSKKERAIATFLLLMGMPCAPLIAVMMIILGRMPVSATLTVFGIIFTQIFVAGVVLNKLMPGERSPFIMEIPPLRIPKALQVLKVAATKTFFFMKEAVPIFIAASLMVFLFQRLGGLEILEHLFSPLTTQLMGLPEKSVQVFIKTLIRRESGAAELEHLSSAYDNLQLVVNLLVMTSLTPCINAIIVLFKERGLKTGAIIVGCVLVYAVTMGGVVNHTCRLLGITFT